MPVCVQKMAKHNLGNIGLFLLNGIFVLFPYVNYRAAIANPKNPESWLEGLNPTPFALT